MPFACCRRHSWRVVPDDRELLVAFLVCGEIVDKIARKQQAASQAILKETAVNNLAHQTQLWQWPAGAWECPPAGPMSFVLRQTSSTSFYAGNTASRSGSHWQNYLKISSFVLEKTSSMVSMLVRKSITLRRLSFKLRSPMFHLARANVHDWMIHFRRVRLSTTCALVHLQISSVGVVQVAFDGGEQFLVHGRAADLLCEVGA